MEGRDGNGGGQDGDGNGHDARTRAKVLLVQHEVLRGLTIDLVQAARLLQVDGIDPLVTVAGRLADELAAHNRLEEEVLEPLLRLGDTWSQVRVAEMLEDHRLEHDGFVAELKLLASAWEPSVELAARVFEVAAVIHRHMEVEEIEYLNAHVLRDEVAPS